MDNSSTPALATDIRVDVVAAGRLSARHRQRAGHSRARAAAGLPAARHLQNEHGRGLFGAPHAGFRGEALASAAAVARVTIVSQLRRTRWAPDITLEGGRVRRPPAARRAARLRGHGARLVLQCAGAPEIPQVGRVRGGAGHGPLQQYALAYPAVRFGIDQRRAPGLRLAGERRSARRDPGRFTALISLRRCLPVGEAPAPSPSQTLPPPTTRLLLDGRRRHARAAAGAPAPRAPEEEGGASVWGYVSPPSASRTNRQAQHFFVNGRAIDSRMSPSPSKRRTTACHGRPPSHRGAEYPGGPGRCGREVHPTKSEVKFRYERSVFVAVQKAVRTALSAA